MGEQPGSAVINGELWGERARDSSQPCSALSARCYRRDARAHPVLRRSPASE